MQQDKNDQGRDIYIIPSRPTLGGYQTYAPLRVPIHLPEW